MYSFSGNSAVSAPIWTFMCLLAIYIVPGSVYIFPPAEKAYRSWEYINRPQTHKCGNWDWDPDIPFLGIFVSKFRYFVFAALGGQNTSIISDEYERAKQYKIREITTGICPFKTLLSASGSIVESQVFLRCAKSRDRLYFQITGLRLATQMISLSCSTPTQMSL
jgi:hypothetical protein